MNSITDIVPWFTTASIAIASLSAVSAALEFFRRRKDGAKDGAADLENFRKRYEKVSLDVDKFEEEIVRQIEISNNDIEENHKDLLKKYCQFIERDASLRWYLAGDLSLIEKLDGREVYEAANLYSRTMGRLDGTKQLLKIFHDKISHILGRETLGRNSS